MNPSPTFKALGIILMLFSLSMLPPLLVNWIFHQDNAAPFIFSFLIIFFTGFTFWVATHKTRRELRNKDGFVVVVLIWSVLALFGAIPYLLSNGLHLSFSEAFFESMSGYTTTGATVINNLDNLPKSILYYRQQSQFFGGMGIIVLVVAILPLIGVGGMNLYRAEASGPMKESKLTPRIMGTAKALWVIYVGLTLACIISYKLCGMGWFDSVCYAYATIGTGGFAPHNASVAYFESDLISIVCVVFMILGGTSFALHFKGIIKCQFSSYWKDEEFKSFIYFLSIISIVIGLTLIAENYYPENETALIDSLFHVVSFGTTTGFTLSTDYAVWPLFIPALLTLVALVGGCAGSTSGGLKVVRAILIKRHAHNELKKIVHPNAIFHTKLNAKVMPDTIMGSVWGFCAAYFLSYMVLSIVLIGLGVDTITAFSAVSACITSVGPGLEAVTDNFANLPATALWILDLAMLIGRLEVFTILVLFVPGFWKK